MSGIIEKIRKHYFNGLNVPKEGFSLQLLHPLLEEFGYIPVANSAMAFQSINTVCNDILYNQRKGIVEFGSGISTLVIANLLKKNGLKIPFFSVENNPHWIEILKGYLNRAGCAEQVQFLYAPSIKHPMAIEGNTWYDMEPHLSLLRQHTFDSVLIDGPEAHTKSIRLSRYPALPFMMDFLDKQRFFVLLDDAARPGEKEVRQRWKQEFGLDFNIKVSKSACCIKGDFFNPVT